MDGKLHYISGRTRMGKSTFVARLTEKSRRCLVYDPKGGRKDYKNFHIITSPVSLIKTLKVVGAGPGRYRLIDQELKLFDLFCLSALAWGKIKPCVVIADELADVTSPGKAPPGWGRLVRTGLGFGIDLYAITNRPAESDKTALGNASLMTTFHLMRDQDRRLVAAEMNIDKRIIDELRPLQGVTVTPGKSPEIFSLK
jgi:hypothetical protein